MAIEPKIDSINWQPTEKIAREFVRYLHPGLSPGKVWQESMTESLPVLSVVIPTADADRGGYFAKLLKQIWQQDFQCFELIVVAGDPRQGRAINIGAALAQGQYLLTLDDDTSLPDPQTFRKLVEVMEEHEAIGMAGGNNIIPQEASWFTQQAMQQIPRRSWKPVDVITDSDLAEHPCLIMRTHEFQSIGGENELMPRGLDPYLRQVFRAAGKRVVILPGIIYHHLPPDTWVTMMRQFFRNGKQSAFVNRHFPQWVIETPDHHGDFALHVPLWRRLLRYPQRLLSTMRKRQWIWLTCQVCYVSGFVMGWVTDVWIYGVLRRNYA